jgi:hypothetical protein
VIGQLAARSRRGFLPEYSVANADGLPIGIALAADDEQGCSLGLRRLRAYRKEWDESRGMWKDSPRRDDASHGTDGFPTFACSNYTQPSPIPTRTRDLGWVV